MITTSKHCPLCDQDLPVEQFNKKRKECRQCSRWVKAIARYGMTQEQYNSKLAEQNGSCAICPYIPRPGEVLAQDHDHSCCPLDKTCGKCLRALLCDWCNRGLGWFADDSERLVNAARYVEEWKLKKEVEKN